MSWLLATSDNNNANTTTQSRDKGRKITTLMSPFSPAQVAAAIL